MRTFSETVTVSSTAVGLTNYTGFKKATITVENDDIRFRVDGGNPTASIGHYVEALDSIVLTDADELRDFRAIRVATDAVLQVTYKEE